MIVDFMCLYVMHSSQPLSIYICLTCILLPFKHYSDLLVPSVCCSICSSFALVPFCLSLLPHLPITVTQICWQYYEYRSWLWQLWLSTCLICLPRLSAYKYWVHFGFCFLLFVSPLPPALFLVQVLGLASVSSNRSVLDPDFYARVFGFKINRYYIYIYHMQIALNIYYIVLILMVESRLLDLRLNL